MRHYETPVPGYGIGRDQSHEAPIVTWITPSKRVRKRIRSESAEDSGIDRG